MKKIIFVVVGIIGLLGLFLFRMVFTDDAKEFYYVRIDNGKIEKQESRGGVIDFTGGMAYGYRLKGYNENGEEKELYLGSERVLKDRAVLKVGVVPIRGVVEWEEVELEEVPEMVRGRL